MFGLKWIAPIAALMLMTGISAFANEQVPAAPEPKGKVTGVVTDAEGNPAGEVKVALKTIVAAAPKGSMSSSPMVHDSNEPVMVAYAKTAADGSFALEAPAGTYTLVAYGNDKGEASTQVTITVDQTVTANLKLVPPAPKAKNG